MENGALSITVAIAAFTICLTAISIYTAFGPPNKTLGDPFDDHED
jgi:PsbN protein